MIPPSFACLTHGLLLCVFYLSRSINWIFREIVAELGVFRGEFSSLISAAFPDRKIHLFDTFEGFSEKDITIEASGNLSRAKTGDFSSTDIDSVLHVMPDPTRTVIHKGWFPDTFSDVTDETFCFVISGRRSLCSNCSRTSSVL